MNDAANVAADNLRAGGCRVESKRNDERNCNDWSNCGEGGNGCEWSKKNSVKLSLKVHLRLLKIWQGLLVQVYGYERTLKK